MNKSPGFTLVELSIVLVIIGLIVGGVLLGRDLIATAELRAQIAQIEKYNTAVNTFRTKYNCLPGDCRDAAVYGFAARGLNRGQGDGNGILEGVDGDPPVYVNGLQQGTGETALLWRDLSDARLINANFTLASATVIPGADVTGNAISNYFPAAKLGYGNYVYVYAAAAQTLTGGGIIAPISGNKLFWGVSAVTLISATPNIPPFPGVGQTLSNATIPVVYAYNIDSKLDDGAPITGRVIAAYNFTSSDALCVDPCSVPASSDRCFDNNSGTLSMRYTLQFNKGESPNCGLSFQIQ